MDRYNYHNYDEYEKAQIMASKKKLYRNWAAPEEMEYLAKYLKARNPDVKSGICHGARNGKEAEWFMDSLGEGSNVIAADISPTIKQFGGVQWDFHEVNSEWTNKFDFVYSNSLDHAYDAQKAVDSWLDSVKFDGVVIIQWTPCGHRDFYPNKVDCFAANLQEYKRMCNKSGVLIDTLRTKEIRKKDNILYYHLIVGKNRKLKML